MSDIIAQLKELEGKATPGPWSQGRLLKTRQTERWTEDARRRGNEEEQKYIFSNFSEHDQGRSRQVVAGCISEIGEPRNDAQFIVALVNAFPTLLRHLEAAEELAKEVEGMDTVSVPDAFCRMKLDGTCTHCGTNGANDDWMNKRDRALSNYRNKIKGV